MSFPLLFDVSGGELIVILLFILLLFGAKGIPDIARTLGRTMRQVRDASDEVRREIHKGAMEVRRGVEEQRKTLLDEPQPLSGPGATPSAEDPSSPERPA